jgi:2-oxoisovalerate dehydrogenase E2 component (dihydrolipoyl transacylase)
MSQFIFKMPDLGEGTVEAEIVAWHTKPGDSVAEDQTIVEVMTDKAAVEVPAPVAGRVISITGEPGDKIAVGSPLIVFELTAGAPADAVAQGGAPDARAPDARAPNVAAPNLAVPIGASQPSRDSLDTSASRSTAQPLRAGRVMTSPANRRRAREAGIDLASVAGSGPGGRILAGDLLALGGHASAVTGAAAVATPGAGTTAAAKAGTTKAGPTTKAAAPIAGATTEIKVIGLRRLIAERMSEAKRTIPHFAYVEEVDVTELESLRQHLNTKVPKGEPGLTYLPFVVSALVRALASFPQCNVLYDASRGVLVRHSAVHVGIATQTPDGLKVPVVRDAQSLGLWDLSANIRRVTERARTNQASRDELSGSTITVTSLGKLGGIASTPIINAPEVAIIGLNKAVERPMVHAGAITVRRIMNLSSSFDHRFVDGYDAAAMIQSLKDLLEHPATIFIPS